MDGDNIGHALRGYAERVDHLLDERKELNETIGGVYAEAKEAGFNVGTLREIVREMRMEPDARNARYQQLAEYREAVGILADTPLGRASEPSSSVPRPRPLAEQPIRRGRGRPRKSTEQALDDARAHLGGGPTKPMFDA